MSATDDTNPSQGDIQKVMPTWDRAFIEAEAERLVRLFEDGPLLKNYGYLHGIGVEEVWDGWAYAKFFDVIGLRDESRR